MKRSSNPGAMRRAKPTQRISTTGPVKPPKNKRAKPMKGERKSAFQIK